VRGVAVHDATASFAAAAANVKCGYFDDRDDVPGMVHMLEHAVHLGSARYPEPGGYKHYLARHGGGSNASTGARLFCSSAPQQVAAFCG
jgi:insulysin